MLRSRALVVDDEGDEEMGGISMDCCDASRTMAPV